MQLRLGTFSALLASALASLATAQGPEPVFVDNVGQWPAELAARARVGGGTAWFLDDGVTLQLKRAADAQPAGAGSLGGPARRMEETALRLRFSGAARRVAPTVEGALAAPRRWVRPGVSSQPEVLAPESRTALRYQDVWPGIDPVFRGVDGRIAYEFDVAPGVSADTIEVTCEGLSAPLAVAADGSLVLATELGAIRHTAPRSFELAADGARLEVPSRFELRGAACYGIRVDRVDPARALWIDPGIDWMTLFGGAGLDVLEYVEHVSGPVFVASGWTDSALPAPWNTAAPGAADGTPVTAFDSASATTLWTTTIDGSGLDWVLDMAFDATTGLTSIVGITSSTDLPVTGNALQPVFGGTYDGFLAQLDLGGNLVYLTYLGGVAEDRLVDVYAQNGIVTVFGATASATMPMAGASWQATPKGGIDGYLAQIDPNQPVASQLLRSTYVGSVANEGQAFNPASYWRNFDQKVVHVATTGEVTVLTNTFFSAAPLSTTVGAFAATPNGGWDTWIARFDAQLSTLQSATLFGGTAFDFPSAAVVDDAGVVTIGMVTRSSNLPVTPGAFDPTYNGLNDTFLVRLDLDQSGANQLLYGSYFGTSGTEEANRVVLEPSSSIATFVGTTGDLGFGFPATTGAYQAQPTLGAYGWHGFMARIDMAGNGPADMHYASYLSPAAGTDILGVAADSVGRFLLVGGSYASAFAASASGPQVVSGGSYDGFAILMDLLPAGVDAIGAASPACAPLAHMQVDSAPISGNTGFSLLCENAPPGAIGVIGFGTPLPGGVSVLGIDAYLAPITVLVVQSDGAGFASFDLPVPAAGMPPFGIAAQFVWLASTPCAGNALTASNALGF